MRTLIYAKEREYESFFLRYLLFEECNGHTPPFYSVLIEARKDSHSEVARARDFTGRRNEALSLLNKLYGGAVTPIGLHSVIEDYIGSR